MSPKLKILIALTGVALAMSGMGFPVMADQSELLERQLMVTDGYSETDFDALHAAKGIAGRPGEAMASEMGPAGEPDSSTLELYRQLRVSDGYVPDDL